MRNNHEPRRVREAMIEQQQGPVEEKSGGALYNRVAEANSPFE